VRVSILIVAVALVPSLARAQTNPTLPVIVFDVRAFYSGLGQDPITAAGIGVSEDELPGRGLGGFAGVHLYPIRGKGIALGIGGEGLIARGREQLVLPEGTPVGLPIQQRLRSLAGVLSLNFGHRDGWSYVAAGMGPMQFSTFQGDTPPTDPPPSQVTLNYGGGARWFFASHVAFGFDIRFYRTPAQDAIPPYPARAANRLLIMSAGVSFK
jgi:hypothetical protein